MHAPSTIGEVVAALDNDREVEELLSVIADSRSRLREILLRREVQLRIAARLGRLGAWLLDLRPLRFLPSTEWYQIHELDPRHPVSLCGALRQVEKSDRRRLIDGLRRCVETGESFNVVIAATSGTGRPVHMRMIAEPSRGPGGAVTSINGACQDVTDQVAREAELSTHRHSLRELVEQRTSDLQTFAYALAHDLRAPISAMAGFAQVLGERVGAAQDPKLAHYVNRIRSNGERAEALVDGILGLISVLQAPLEHHVVDLSRIARDTVGHLRAAEPQRTVEAQVQSNLFVCGDRKLLLSVLTNLLANAWKFTRVREAALIEVGRDGERGFYVRDNGVGFDPGQAGDLFKPLRRLHSQAEFEGSGVGLATACRIVQRHGGRMWAEARPGEGATFWFTLPTPQ